MSLTRPITLYLILLFAPMAVATARAASGQIELQIFPALESIHPLSKPVRIVLKDSDADGKTLQGTKFSIRLYAPPPGRFLSTDFPLIEKTLLIEMELVAAQGTAMWEYVFPIRGVYRLEVSKLNGAGTEVSEVFPLHIRENRTKLLYLGIFVVSLFFFGVVIGRLFTTPNKGDYVIAGFLVALCALSIAPGWGAEPQVMNYENKGPLPRLEISPSRVGQPSKIHWRLSEGETERLLPSRLSLAITHIEKGKRLFFLDKIPTDGDFNLKFHFTDASPHRVSGSAEVEGWQPVRAEKNVAVSSESPPRDVTFRTLFLFLCVLGLGLVTGRISRRWKR
ncbi:MAG: hypothetical protein ACE5FB_04550 [Candidatus Binatia bacterium]